MTATMSAPGVGSAINRTYGTPLREILHPEAVAAEKAARVAARVARMAADQQRIEELKALELARRAHDQAVDQLENTLPPIGSIIRARPGFQAALHQTRDVERPGLLVKTWVVDEFPTAPHRALFANPEAVGGLLCFLSYASVQRLHHATYGYLEYAEVHAVKVIGHAKNGRSIRVEVVE